MNLILDCIFFPNLVIRKIRAKFADHLISSTCGGVNNMHWCANLTPRIIFLCMFSLISCLLFICWYWMYVHKLPQIILLVMNVNKQISCVRSIKGFLTWQLNHIAARNVVCICLPYLFSSFLSPPTNFPLLCSSPLINKWVAVCFSVCFLLLSLSTEGVIFLKN